MPRRTPRRTSAAATQAATQKLYESAGATTSGGDDIADAEIVDDDTSTAA